MSSWVLLSGHFLRKYLIIFHSGLAWEMRSSWDALDAHSLNYKSVFQSSQVMERMKWWALSLHSETVQVVIPPSAEDWNRSSDPRDPRCRRAHGSARWNPHCVFLLCISHLCWIFVQGLLVWCSPYSISDGWENKETGKTTCFKSANQFEVQEILEPAGYSIKRFQDNPGLNFLQNLLNVFDWSFRSHVEIFLT